MRQLPPSGKRISGRCRLIPCKPAFHAKSQSSVSWAVLPGNPIIFKGLFGTSGERLASLG